MLVCNGNVKKSSSDLLTYCFCFAVRFFHNPLETFVLGRGDLVPRRLMFTPMIQMLLVAIFRARRHKQLTLLTFIMQTQTDTQRNKHNLSR